MATPPLEWNDNPPQCSLHGFVKFSTQIPASPFNETRGPYSGTQRNTELQPGLQPGQKAEENRYGLRLRPPYIMNQKANGTLKLIFSEKSQ